MQVGDGKNALFWSDRWINGQSVAELAPCLLQTVGKHIQNWRTVFKGLQNQQWVRDISGALTVQVIIDFLCIWEKVFVISLNPEQQDLVLWKWTADRKFTTSSTYKAFFIVQFGVAGAKVLHKVRAPAKCKLFVWLALYDRYWTASRRKRHGHQDDDTCALCDQDSETTSHLLLSCSKSRTVWHSILARIGLRHLTLTQVAQPLAG
jgi:hypothetical protein